MNYISCVVLRYCSIAVLGLILTACSNLSPGISPGLGLRTAPGNDALDSTGADENTTGAVLKEITAQLVQSEKAMRSSRADQDLSGLMVPVVPYTIESGDTLSVVVWDHPELNGAATSVPASGPDAQSGAVPSVAFAVDRDGLIHFPYAGTLKVAGLTQDAARNLLVMKLARYINKPNVTLQVQSYRSKRIYVDGEVKQPGVHTITDIPMTLVEALNRAGGMLPSADQSRINLSRNGTNYLINLPKLVQQGVNPASIMLQSGDVLRVRSRDESKVFVSGEVVAPRALVMHNGRLSLNEALGESGGVNPLSGDAGQVYVVRRSAAEPVVYRLNANAPGALALAEGFELDPKDVVYVAATPLTNWHRTISQMLPGAIPSAMGVLMPGR